MRGFDKKTRAECARRYLAQVGLAEFNEHKSYELSGGMRQRACLARVLANDPRIVLMDEPFGALDAITRGNMQQLTRNIWGANEAKNTFLLITHDVDEALSLGTRVLVMSSRPGRIIREFPVTFTYHITNSSKDRTQFTKEYIDLREEIMDLIHGETQEYVI
jgi:taurine transport system ATP-binding protein